MRRRRPLLVGCYRPPNSTNEFFEHLESVLDKITDMDMVLLGDFNAKHQEWFTEDPTNAHGASLKDLMDRFNLSQLCYQPTHLNSEGVPASLLDLVFTNIPDLLSPLVDVMAPIGRSDHLPVVVQSAPHFSSNIPDAISSHPDPVIARTKWLFHQQDGEKKLDAFLLENWTQVFAEKEDINEVWKRWKAQFFQDIKSFIGHEIKNQQSGPPTLKSPWFSNDIHRLVRAKNRLFRRGVSSGKENHWKIYCAARNKATAAIRLAKASFLNRQAQILSDPNCPPSKWWSLAKDLCGINGKGQMTVPPSPKQCWKNRH